MMMALMYVAAAAQPTRLMMLEAAVGHAVAYVTDMDVEYSTICCRRAEDLVAVAHNNDDVVRVLCAQKKQILELNRIENGSEHLPPVGP